MSNLLRMISMLYSELIKVGVDPVRADEHELWQLAALFSPSEAAGADPNDPAEINRRFIEERYKAAREGRELDPESLQSGMSETQVNAIRGSL